MAGINVLHASDIARYRWGGLLLSLSGGPTANGRMIAQMLAQAEVRVFRWTKPRDIRAAISILHELVHLQQDLSTGMGAWDHLQTRRNIGDAIYEARTVFSSYADPPYREVLDALLAESEGVWAGWDKIRESISILEEKTVAWRQFNRGTWYTPAARAALKRWEGLALEDDSEYSLRRLLESEAAIHVDTTIRNARGQKETQIELQRYERLWSLDEMPEVYNEAVQDVMLAFVNAVPTAELYRAVYPQVLLFAGWLLDLVQSYPPHPVEQYGDDAPMFDPVVRFVVLVRAINKMSQADSDEMATALLAGEVWRAEEVLLKYSAFPYPLSRAVYSAWLTILDELADSNEWDAPLFRVRRDAIAHRIKTGRAKGVREFPEARIPVQVSVEGRGVQGIVVGQDFLEESRGPLLNAIVQRNMDLELHDLLLASGTFACPYAISAICPARTVACGKGISHLADLPPREGCYVRRDLEELGYRLPNRRT